MPPSRTSAADARPSPAERSTKDDLLKSTTELFDNARGMVPGGSALSAAANLAKPAISTIFNGGKAIQEAKAVNTAAQAAAKAAPLAKAIDDGMLGMGGGSASTAASTSTTTTTAAVVGGGRLAGMAGPIGLGAAAIAATAALSAAPFIAAANRMSQAREQLAEFSPEVARARAQADVRQVVANLRSADRIGGDTADFTEAVSRLSVLLQDIKDSFVTAVGPEVNALLDNLVIIAKGASVLASLQEKGNDWWRARLGVDKIYERLDKIADFLDPNDGDDFMKWFENQPWVMPPDGEVGAGQVQGVQFNAIPGLNL